MENGTYNCVELVFQRRSSSNIDNEVRGTLHDYFGLSDEDKMLEEDSDPSCNGDEIDLNRQGEVDGDEVDVDNKDDIMDVGSGSVTAMLSNSIDALFDFYKKHTKLKGFSVVRISCLG